MEDLYLKNLESEIVRSDISREGNYIFGLLTNNRIFLINLQTDYIRYIDTEGEVVNIEMSEKDSLLAIVYNNEGIVCDFNGNKQYVFETTVDEVMNERLVCFFMRGDFQLAVVKENGAEIYDQTGNIAYSFKGHRERVNSVDVSPDGRFIATASNDRKVYIWNYNKEKNNFSIYDSLVGHRGIVWSCEFNNMSKYILTASEDSIIRIWDLNGIRTDAWFYFGENYQNTRRWKSEYEENNEDASDKNLSVYFNKCCNASFNRDELSVVATGYSVEKDTTGNNVIIYNQVLHYDVNSSFYKLRSSDFYFFYDEEGKTIIPEVFDHLIISPSCVLAAGVNSKNKGI